MKSLDGAPRAALGDALSAMLTTKGTSLPSLQRNRWQTWEGGEAQDVGVSLSVVRWKYPSAAGVWGASTEQQAGGAGFAAAMNMPAEHGGTSMTAQPDGTPMMVQQDGTPTTADSVRVFLLPAHELDLIGSGSELRPLGELGCRSAKDRDLKCSTSVIKHLSRTVIVNSYKFAQLTLDNIASAPNINAVRQTTDYATIYDAAFNLVIASEGHRLYALVRSALKRMAQRCNRAHFLEGAHMIHTTCIYLEKTYLRKRELPLIMDVAEAYWNTPVIRRWRRFIRFARWTGFIARCRLAFVEVSLHPDACGLAELARHFYGLAGSASSYHVGATAPAPDALGLCS